VRVKDSREKVIEKFWAQVKKASEPDGCWEWQAGKSPSGYGRIWDGQKNLVASRFSYELHKGVIPKGYFVCHHCDNPACVRPDHLFLGTQKDNIQDAKQKGRLKRTEETRKKQGEAHKGKHHSVETREKQREAAKKRVVHGHPQSKETRIKISVGLKGKHPSEETRKRQSESRKSYFAREKLRGCYRMDVILRVIEVKAQEQYASKTLTVSPVGDILYLVQVPDKYVSEYEGKKVLTIEGIRHIIHATRVALQYDVDKQGDF
jgi:hypothetical protein